MHIHINLESCEEARKIPMNRSTSSPFQRNSSKNGGCLYRFDNESNHRQHGGSAVTRYKLDHYDNPHRDELDYKKQRKTRRKEERDKKKQARIDAHHEWTVKRREARATAEFLRARKRERQEEKTPYTKENEVPHANPHTGISAEVAQRSPCEQLSKKSVERTAKGAKSSSRSSRNAEKGETFKKGLGETRNSKNKDSKEVRRHRNSRGESPSSDQVSQKRLRSTTIRNVDVTNNNISNNSTDEASLMRAPHSCSEGAVVPPAVVESTRRCVNKITMTNVVALTRDVSDLFGSTTIAGASRATVLTGLLHQINRLCQADTGPLTQAGALPLAGLIRGLQLLHGPPVGAGMIERLCLFIQNHLDEAAENAAGNLAMLLAYLYLLYGVEARLIVSFLGALFREIAGLSGHLSGLTSAADLVVRRALAAASCGLTVLRTCGGKLRKEAPQEMELALREAERGIARLNSGGTPFSLVRFTVLVEAMGEIVSGRMRKGRRAVTETEAPVEAMLDDLCEILGQTSSNNKGNSNSGSFSKRTQRRIIQTACMLSGVSWELVLLPEKPPRWYAAATELEPFVEESPNPEKKAESKPNNNSNMHDKNGDSQQEDSVSSESLSSSSSSGMELARKQASIRILRQEEKAIAGQRFNTEHKREIFKAVVAAADDLECFSLLMYRDPSYSRFHDVCMILIQCCCQETRYNPYYASVLERFCNSKSACQRKLQFALWDRFKGIRIEPVNVATYLNLASFITSLLENGVFTLSVLRGLDLENINKTIGLFTRVLLLRMLVQLSPNRITELFFGGDGFHVHDLNTDMATFRDSLRKFMERYFVDEAMANRWLPPFYDVVAAGTSLDVHPISELSNVDCKDGNELDKEPQKSVSVDGMQKLQEFTKRIRIAFKALKHGIA